MKARRPVIPSTERDGTPFPRPAPDARDALEAAYKEIRRLRKDLKRASARLSERSATLTAERKRGEAFHAAVREALKTHQRRYFAGCDLEPAILNAMIFPIGGET